MELWRCRLMELRWCLAEGLWRTSELRLWYALELRLRRAVELRRCGHHRALSVGGLARYRAARCSLVTAPG